MNVFYKENLIQINDFVLFDDTKVDVNFVISYDGYLANVDTYYNASQDVSLYQDCTVKL